MVCATVLDGIATKYTVSSCNQEVTFSSQYGYVLATPTATRNVTYTNSTAMITPAPTVQTLTTYFLTPWQELTSAGAPTDVDLKVCTTYANGTEECIVEYQVWETSVVTVTTSSVTSINLTTAIQGPSQVIVETFVANVTELITTLSLSTTMQLEYQTEIESTSSGTRDPTSTGLTIFETFTVEEAS